MLRQGALSTAFFAQKPPDFLFAPDDDDEEVEPAQTSSFTRPEIELPSVDVKEVTKELSSKAQELSAKARDVLNDPKVKEAASSAKDFAQGVAGSVFSSIGGKLKELKKEKDARGGK